MSDFHLELAYHPLCPFSQRALFVADFKGIQVTKTLVDLANPSEWFLDLNPLQETPALKLTRNSEVYRLTESLNICEYFNSFPGPSLYPLLNGQINRLEKGIIDVFIKLHLSDFVYHFNNCLFNEPDAEKIQEFRNFITFLENHLEGGNYVMHKTLGRNELTIADVAIFSFVERLVAWKDHAHGLLNNASGLLAWYEKLSQEPWISANKVPLNRLHKIFEIRKQAEYKPLALPLEIYD